MSTNRIHREASCITLLWNYLFPHHDMDLLLSHVNVHLLFSINQLYTWCYIALTSAMQSLVICMDIFLFYFFIYRNLFIKILLYICYTCFVFKMIMDNNIAVDNIMDNIAVHTLHNIEIAWLHCAIGTHFWDSKITSDNLEIAIPWITHTYIICIIIIHPAHNISIYIYRLALCIYQQNTYQYH